MPVSGLSPERLVCVCPLFFLLIASYSRLLLSRSVFCVSSISLLVRLGVAPVQSALLVARPQTRPPGDASFRRARALVLACPRSANDTSDRLPACPPCGVARDGHTADISVCVAYDSTFRWQVHALGYSADTAPRPRAAGDSPGGRNTARVARSLHTPPLLPLAREIHLFLLPVLPTYAPGLYIPAHTRRRFLRMSSPALHMRSCFPCADNSIMMITCQVLTQLACFC